MAKRLIQLEIRGVRLLLDRLEDLTPVLNGAGAYLVSRAQRSFREQRRGSKSWPERMTPNVPGIVSDLNRGATPPQRRFESRPALTDTGRLRGSITWSTRGGKEAIVGTTLPYARKQQFGLPSRHQLTKPGQDRLADLLKSRPELRPSLGWLFHTPSFDVKPQARPFLMVTDEDSEVVLGMVSDYFSSVDDEGGA